MTQVPITHTGDLDPHKHLIYVWQVPVRIFHWTTALCITVLFFTGLYIAFPLFSTPGEPYQSFLMAQVRQIHFIAAFVWIVAFMLRSYCFIAGNRYARSGFPFVWRAAWWRELRQETVGYLTLGRASAPRIGHNALAGLAYTIFPIGLGMAQILTGLAMFSESDPSGFWGRLVGWVLPLMGGSFQTHMWHHLFAWAFVWFVIAHVYIIVFDSIRDRNSLVESMITGYKARHGPEDKHAD